MLLRFRGANHRSFRDEFELWTAASRFNVGSGRPAGLAADPESAYLPTVVIYGANASGKSSVLHAMRWMRRAVLGSVDKWSSLAAIPREPFALDPDARDETSLFEVNIVLDGDRYVYGFEVSDERVESEWLHAYPEGRSRRQVWFERDADSKDPFKFPGEGLKGDKERLVPRTRPNALFLTVAAAFNQPYLSPIHAWFRQNLWFVAPGEGESVLGGFTAEKLRDPATTDRIIKLLKVADLGIDGAESEVVDGRTRIRLLHRGKNESVPLNFHLESQGTRSWFAFLGPMIEALDKGAVLMFDELDASLHPTLAAEALRIFQDPQANENHAQLICATQDVTLLGNLHPFPPLERDQVRLVIKDRLGRSELYPLTDARPRKDEPLDRRYLAGGYGGVPRVTAGEAADALSSDEAEVCA
ncbi:ATP/GTP-binding protein [Actinomadura sp. BRA 177]|uniref:AAA family ATPase n=1 Tax=Actinomadura sp. BRA 177 TaxID=2745202 RepID=UPI0015959272|nr:ATP-binding protein [Actinomadura sp. BRA 177]NVI86045.1 ATP-binding protein [Actinomadura sp. BRA 177]